MPKRNRAQPRERPFPNAKRFQTNVPGGDAGIGSGGNIVLDYDGASGEDAGRELIFNDETLSAQVDEDDDHIDENDEEEPQQKFAFPGLPAKIVPVDLDPLVPPKDALEYMSRVRFEAVQIPQFKTVDRESKLLSNIPSQISSPIEKPINIDSKWQNEFLLKFEMAKREIEEMKPTDLPEGIELPLTFSKWKLFINKSGTPIDLPLLLSFDHALLIRLLGYSRKWVSANMSEQLGKWIYSILVRIPTVLDADDISVLRDLARKCISTRRQTLHDLSPTVKYILDSTILIVAKYYGQHDLNPYV